MRRGLSGDTSPKVLRDLLPSAGTEVDGHVLSERALDARRFAALGCGPSGPSVHAGSSPVGQPKSLVPRLLAPVPSRAARRRDRDGLGTRLPPWVRGFESREASGLGRTRTPRGLGLEASRHNQRSSPGGQGFVAGVGLEPTTSRLGGERAIHLPHPAVVRVEGLEPSASGSRNRRADQTALHPAGSAGHDAENYVSPARGVGAAWHGAPRRLGGLPRARCAFAGSTWAP